MNDDIALLDELKQTRIQLIESIGQAIVGQSRVIELMMVSLFADGHCLFVGVPGLAKTLLVRTVAEAVGVGFGRVQFTPDLMPADMTGTDILEEDRATGERRMRFVQGPVFTNLLLADEINRTPPKTQAALLQAMQERQVTAMGRTWALPEPFLVFATQNPIEQEGTYPLPEAQQDRFLLSLAVDYPSEDEEREIVIRTTMGDAPVAPKVLDAASLQRFQSLLRRLPANPDVVDFCVRLARASRNGNDWIQWGAGPRASQGLAVAARAWAALRGRAVATVDDVLEVAKPVLRHRIVLNFEAEAAQVTTDDVVDTLLSELRSNG